VDWALGRERYWGTPLPVWQCEACGHRHCIGSVEELQAMAKDKAATVDLDLKNIGWKLDGAHLVTGHITN
jgi:isoleucyl-tRNA synthetase